MVEKTAFARGPAGFANEFDGVDFEEKGRSAAVFGSFGIENVGFAEGEIDGVEFAGAFVEKIAEVGGGSVGGGDGEIHERQLYREFRA